MKPLKVDFARRRSIGVWPWVVMACALGSLSAYQGHAAWKQHVRVQAKEHERRNLMEKLQAADTERRNAIARLSVTPAYAADATAIAKWAEFPLDRVLLSLESAQIEGAKVTGLEISTSEGSARVELEAADHATLLAYLDEINSGEPKPRWVLLQARSMPTAGAGTTGTIVSSWTERQP